MRKRVSPSPQPMIKITQWTIDGLGGRCRELRELIGRSKTTVVDLNENKTMNIEGIRDAWPGAGLEEIPAARKERGTEPREKIAVVIQPGVVNYADSQIYNERDVLTNGMVQDLTIELRNRLRLTGAYVSPSSSPGATN